MAEGGVGEEDVVRLRERVARIKGLEAALYQEDSAYRADLLRLQKATRAGPPEVRTALAAVERSRPVRVPFLLWAALGSANLMLPDRERARYKASYERFKMAATVTHLALSLVLLLVTDVPWLDAASNYVLVYAYSTMTLREHILQLNGSAMHAWWVVHHYLCICLAGTLLIWPATPLYHSFRPQMLYFMVYIAAVQMLQYRYQMNRLYTLRALSRVSAMQTTTDSASVHVSNSLAFLLPFLLAGHAWQFRNSFVLLCATWAAAQARRPAVGLAAALYVEWQAIAIGVLFGVIGAGNLGTTLWTLYLKRRRAVCERAKSE